MKEVIRWVLYFALMGGVTFLLLYWINGSRLRRMRVYRKRGSAAEIWNTLFPDMETEIAVFLSALAEGFDIPREIALCFRPDDTMMSIYLQMYPTHCMYDNEELTRLTDTFRKNYPTLKNVEISHLGNQSLEKLFGEVYIQCCK